MRKDVVSTVEVRAAIEQSIHDNLGDSLLLSGGLDTSIIAHMASRERKISCYTVIFPYIKSPDLHYARYIVRKLDLPWRLVKILPGKEIDEKLLAVIEIMHTFDPMEVRNSVVIYEALNNAAHDDMKIVMTGDGCDELFAGYSFIYNLNSKALLSRLRRLWRIMSFSSIKIARSLSISVSLPYLDERVKKVAKKLTYTQFVGIRSGVKYGKFILRVAFESIIGKELAWRVKMPIEQGSGTSYLPFYFDNRISDKMFMEERERIHNKEGVRIRDKEHLAYYLLYRKLFSPPTEIRKTKHSCPECGGDADPSSNFCKICGAYPIRAVLDER